MDPWRSHPDGGHRILDRGSGRKCVPSACHLRLSASGRRSLLYTARCDLTDPWLRLMDWWGREIGAVWSPCQWTRGSAGIVHVYCHHRLGGEAWRRLSEGECPAVTEVSSATRRDWGVSPASSA